MNYRGKCGWSELNRSEGKFISRRNSKSQRVIENFRPGGSGENEIAARRSWQRKNPEGLCFRPELPDSVRRSGKGKGLATQRTTSIVRRNPVVILLDYVRWGTIDRFTCKSLAMVGDQKSLVRE